MIKSLIKDFNENELEQFVYKFPKRHNLLCKILGEFELDKRYLYVGVVLPYKDDRGCISASIIENEITIVVDIRYF